MTHEMSLLLPIFYVATPIVGGVIWLIRLEAKVKTNEKLFSEFKEYEKDREEKLDNSLSKIYSMIGDVQQSVSRIEGRMEK